VFPSYFLAPGKPDAFPVADCVHERAVAVRMRATPQEYLKCLTAMLRPRVVTDRAERTVRLFCAASYGEFLLAAFTCEGKRAPVAVRATAPALADAIATEIERGLRAV
jgi:hypothetical protein